MIWPRGFTAQFAPTLEVLDGSGKVVFREGDRILDACTAGIASDPASLLLIEAPR